MLKKIQNYGGKSHLVGRFFKILPNGVHDSEISRKIPICSCLVMYLLCYIIGYYFNFFVCKKKYELRKTCDFINSYL